MWGNIIKYKKNITQLDWGFSIRRAIKWKGWKAVTLFINKWGIKRTDPANKKAKNKLSKPNRAALEEPRQRNIIDLKGISAKNSSLSRKENI